MAGQLDFFRALGDPTRLRVFHLLRAMELSVGEIAQVMGQSQPRVSRHIRILVDAGLVDRRREGSWVFLTTGDGPATRRMLEWFEEVMPAHEEQLWIEADLARLEAVRAGRTRAAAQYFADHAEQWDAIRSLHAPDIDVEGAMQRLLSGRALGRLLDIGTGTGRMAELFGTAASTVTAIDRSPDMLRLARAKLDAEEAGRYRLMVGDFNALPVGNACMDTVILHQVLHYAQAPEQAVAEIARVLAPDGIAVVVDFAPHEREELRVQAAHARLGFSDAQMREWFMRHGLVVDATETLSGGALTVKIWMGRKRVGNIRALREGTGTGR